MSEADAAAVASKLLDFYREPARYRPRYLSGQETISGQWVFKFAQARFPHAVLRAFDLDERRRLREAAQAFIRQVCFRDAASYFEMLGVQPATKLETIKGNYHLLMALIHPDRQEAQAASWPTGCAQRVNRAYAVLSDEHARRDYESSLQKIGNGAAHVAQAPGRGEPSAARAMSPRRRRRSRVRAIMLVTAVMATVLLMQMYWVSDLPAEYRLLERSYPVELSVRWMRSVFPSSEQPRFLTENAWSPRSSDAADDAPAPRPQRPRNASTVKVVIDSASEPAAPSRTRTPILEPPAPLVPAIRVAADTAPALPAAPAQGAPQTITSSDIEALVARLVSSYESGDLESLMALVDRAEASSLRGEQMRQLYREFFRATRQRRLHLNTLAWRLGAASAQARGDAALSAEYFDQPTAVERRVDVEVDIALREGRPRITRLALYPNGS